jgi:hypothetical protein
MMVFKLNIISDTLCKSESVYTIQKLYQDWEIILRNKGLYSQHFISFVTHESGVDI